MSMTQYDHQNNACHSWVISETTCICSYVAIFFGQYWFFRQFWVWVLWFQTEAPRKCVHPTEVMNLPLPEGSNSQLQLSLVKLAQDEKNTCLGKLQNSYPVTRLLFIYLIWLPRPANSVWGIFGPVGLGSSAAAENAVFTPCTLRVTALAALSQML